MNTRRANPRTPGAPRSGRCWLAWLLLFVMATGAAAPALREGLQRTGRTPAELLDYVEHRLEGHNRLVALASPFIVGLRGAVDAPSMSERMAVPFEIPPPPPRRGPANVAPPPAPAAGAQVWRVGPGAQFLRIADVAPLAKDGDIVEIEAGDYHGDVATWAQKRLTIRGVNGEARLFAGDRIAEGMAIWVIRRGEFDIANIDFIGAKPDDMNGAGIRFEGGTLRVRHCLFWGNQMGLMTSGRPHAADTRLEVESSEFAYSHVPGRWGHNLYVGTIEHLRVVGSYSHHAYRGHLLKSRAQVNEILYNRFTDESGGRASYELDFPNGGTVRMLGNVVQQQQDTENGVIVSVGEEGYIWPRTTVTMASNTLVNDHPHGGAFLRVSPGAERVETGNNLLVGPGRSLFEGRLSTANDARADWEHLARQARQDYRPWTRR